MKVVDLLQGRVLFHKHISAFDGAKLSAKFDFIKNLKHLDKIADEYVETIEQLKVQEDEKALDELLQKEVSSSELAPLRKFKPEDLPEDIPMELLIAFDKLELVEAE